MDPIDNSESDADMDEMFKQITQRIPGSVAHVGEV